MITPTFKGNVKEGKLVLEKRALFDMWLVGLEGKDVVVNVRKYGKIRSSKENNYYWGIIIPIIQEYTGMFQDEVHEALKWKFLRMTRNGLETCRSTASLTTKEFEDYCASIRVWARLDFNLNIPLPNEI